MKDYRLFDIYDFLSDDDFIRWVKEGKKADNELWNNWLDQNPEKHIIIAEARRILKALELKQEHVSEPEKNAEIKKLLQTIQETSIEPLPSDHRRSFVFFRKWKYAAAVLLTVSLSTIAYYFARKPAPLNAHFNYSTVIASKDLIENKNQSSKPIKLVLPDGSTAELSPNSRISYANSFDSAGTRDVYLSGEAFFTVVKNPSRPFRVFANEIVARVLGTSFAVRCFDNDSTIQVKVRTGKVSVYSQMARLDAKETASLNKSDAIILAPNQEIVYKKSIQKFEKTLLDDPQIIVLPKENEALIYEDAPVEQVLLQLSMLYGINIVYDSEVLSSCTITADFRSVPFYEKIKFICNAIGASFEIMDGQITIQASGCK
jgi:transmembrane sensor